MLAAATVWEGLLPEKESMPQHEQTIRVRYAETDAMGVAHHASYIVWLEEGRTSLLRSIGVPYPEIEAAGFFVVLSDLRARYLGAARYDDVLTLLTELTTVRSRQVCFDYALRSADGRQLLTARTEHIIVAQRTMRPARLPDALLRRMADDQ